jgi:hypothetical protein
LKSSGEGQPCRLIMIAYIECSNFGEGHIQQLTGTGERILRHNWISGIIVYAGHNEPTVTAVSIEMSGVLLIVRIIFKS